MAQEIAEQNERLRELNNLLEQRVSDANMGLSSAQEFLENIDVGVLTVDRTGLVVSANRRAYEIISSCKSELIGISAQTALPDALYELVRTAGIPTGSSEAGHFVHEGRKLQCRVNPLADKEHYRGSVIALWEEVV